MEEEARLILRRAVGGVSGADLWRCRDSCSGTIGE
jgi:hypothetical protein